MDGLLPQNVKRATPKPADTPDLGLADMFVIDAAHAAAPVESAPPLIFETTSQPEFTPEDLPDDLQIYAGSLYAWAICWLIAIIGTTQAVKVLTRGFVSRKRYEQLKRGVPVIVSTATAPIFGPSIALAFGFEFTPLQALALFGPGAGVAAMGVYTIMIPERFKKVMGSNYTLQLESVTVEKAPDNAND